MKTTLYQKFLLLTMALLLISIFVFSGRSSEPSKPAVEPEQPAMVIYR